MDYPLVEIYESKTMKELAKAVAAWDSLCEKRQVCRIHDGYFMDEKTAKELHAEFMRTYPQLAGFLHIEERGNV